MVHHHRRASTVWSTPARMAIAAATRARRRGGRSPTCVQGGPLGLGDGARSRLDGLQRRGHGGHLGRTGHQALDQPAGGSLVEGQLGRDHHLATPLVRRPRPSRARPGAAKPAPAPTSVSTSMTGVAGSPVGGGRPCLSALTTSLRRLSCSLNETASARARASAWLSAGGRSQPSISGPGHVGVERSQIGPTPVPDLVGQGHHRVGRPGAGRGAGAVAAGPTSRCSATSASTAGGSGGQAEVAGHAARGSGPSSSKKSCWRPAGAPGRWPAAASR